MRYGAHVLVGKSGSGGSSDWAETTKGGGGKWRVNRAHADGSERTRRLKTRAHGAEFAALAKRRVASTAVVPRARTCARVAARWPRVAAKLHARLCTCRCARKNGETMRCKLFSVRSFTAARRLSARRLCVLYAVARRFSRPALDVLEQQLYIFDITFIRLHKWGRPFLAVCRTARV